MYSRSLNIKYTETCLIPGHIPLWELTSIPTLLTNAMSDVVVLLLGTKPRDTKVQLPADFAPLSHGKDAAQSNYCLRSFKPYLVRLELPLNLILCVPGGRSVK
jgi:hypothetical protein